MIESLSFPKEEKKMLPLKLTEALENRVVEVLFRGIEQTPADIDGYPDLSIFSSDDMKRSGFNLRIYGEIIYEGHPYYVGPKIEMKS